MIPPAILGCLGDKGETLAEFVVALVNVYLLGEMAEGGGEGEVWEEWKRLDWTCYFHQIIASRQGKGDFKIAL